MRRLALALLALFALATPDRAAAQLFTWDYLCALGSVQACANFSLALSYDPTPQNIGGQGFAPEGMTRALFSIQNLQGSSIPGLPTQDPWQFTRFDFTGMATTWTTRLWELGGPYSLYDTGSGVPTRGYLGGNVTVFADRPVEAVPGDVEPWEAYAQRQQALGHGLYSADLTGHIQSDTGGFFGCDGTAGGFTSGGGWIGGCGTTFYFSMLLPGKWSLTDRTSFSWAGRYHPGGLSRPSIKFSCTVGVDCAYASVPEPSGGLLLATSLLGFAVVRRRRATA